MRHLGRGSGVLGLGLSLALLSCSPGGGSGKSTSDRDPGKADDGTAGPSQRVDFGFITGAEGGRDASPHGAILDFTFRAELVVERGRGDSAIRRQLMYTQGQLNGESAGPKLQYADVSGVEVEEQGALDLVKYTAKMTVAWGGDWLPESYELKFPRDLTYEGERAFYEKYKGTCVDPYAHDLSAYYFWYDYRPQRCTFEEGDAVVAAAAVARSADATEGKYPEYDMVWADGALQSLIVFGKDEQDATSPWDGGIRDYNNFVRLTRRQLEADPNVTEVKTTPEEIPDSPGVEVPDVTFEATLDDGKKVIVVAILVRHIRTPRTGFDERFGQLSEAADFLAYNGHSGLGANIAAFSRRIRHKKGQYSIVFLNGCDTYSYVEDELIAPRREANQPDDPQGTKYLDIVLNAMPAYMDAGAPATVALIEGLMQYGDPLTYEQMMQDIDERQVVLVTGEQDNIYQP